MERQNQFRDDAIKDCNGAGINYIFAPVMAPPHLRNFFKEARQGVAALCLFLFLALQAMAAVPALHALIHSDSSDPSHQCAVTLFLHGQVHASSAAVEVAGGPPVFAARPLFGTVVFVSSDVRLLPSRGPPALRSII
ncbi:MAG TPA: hypothetical protein VMR33_00075 [Candidatus Baltobacteraceae bacterium]|nr:hypothetical protein [Candidatus Baltobacteraceae bacterium]